jgi:hypothetical protein
MPARREIVDPELGDALADDLSGRVVEGPCRCGSLGRGGITQAQHEASLIMARVMRPTSGLPRTPSGRKVLRSNEAQGLAQRDSRTDLMLVCGCLHVLEQCRLHKHVDEVYSGWQGFVDGSVRRMAAPPPHHVPQDWRAFPPEGLCQRLSRGMRLRIEANLVADTGSALARLGH